MLTEKQIQLLKSAARPRYIHGKENPMFGRENKFLDEVITRIKEANPQSFLTPSELSKRVFFHKPKDAINPKHQVVYARYVTPYLGDRL